MKKSYVRPAILFESYELNQSVATCGWKMNHSDEASCQAFQDFDNDNQPDFGLTGAYLFTKQDGACAIKGQYCYTTGGLNGATTFSS